MNVNAVLEGTLAGGLFNRIQPDTRPGRVTNSFVDDNVRREAELQLNQAAEADFVSLHTNTLCCR